MEHAVTIWNMTELFGTCDNRMSHAGIIWNMWYSYGTCGNIIEHTNTFCRKNSKFLFDEASRTYN
jgi:hypothetical protein